MEAILKGIEAVKTLFNGLLLQEYYDLLSAIHKKPLLSGKLVLYC